MKSSVIVKRCIGHKQAHRIMLRLMYNGFDSYCIAPHGKRLDWLVVVSQD